MGLKTTTAGWMPQPAELRRARARHAEGQLSLAALRQEEQRATRAALELQVSAGVDLPTDGQMDRGDLVADFIEGLEGGARGGLVRCFGNRYVRRPRLVGPVSRRDPVTVGTWSHAQAGSDRPVKAVLAGPYTLMHWSYDEHYKSREQACMALAAAVRDEALDLVAAGAREIAIDEPAAGARSDEFGLVVRALGSVTEALRGQARTWSLAAFGGLPGELRRLWALPVDVVHVDLSHADAEALAAIADLPDERLLVAGVIDAVDAEVESPGEIERRVTAVLGRLPAERLWIGPSAGFRAIAASRVEAKLRALTAVAARLG
jgi:5-methyltetrahydropteroyltriglutamate--homocysteine methyltransferase